MALVATVDGWRGIRETWPIAVVCGVVFAVAQYATSNFVSVPLADVVAALLSAAAVVGMVRIWRPSRVPTPRVMAGGAADGPDAPDVRDEEGGDSRADVIRAYAPYGIIVAVFVICQIGPVKSLLNGATFTFKWPGLNVIDADGDPVRLTTITMNLLTTPGTQTLFAGVVTMLVLKLSVPRAVKAYGATVYQLRWAIVTVMAVLALAFVTNVSGQTITLGTLLAGAGMCAICALQASPVLSWLVP